MTKGNSVSGVLKQVTKLLHMYILQIEIAKASSNIRHVNMYDVALFQKLMLLQRSSNQYMHLLIPT